MSPLAQVNPFLTLSAALDYIQRGWFIFPCWGVVDGECLCSKRGECERPGKHPLGRLVPNGLLDATNDEDIAKSWFKQYPQANIAGATGPKSGFWAWDEDAYKAGVFSREDLERRNSRLPFTMTSRTGSGGGSRHRLFNYPSGLHIPSRALPGVSGIDIKGAGGYIILPPSMHKSGGIYAWEDEDDARIVDAPEWLLNLVCAKPPTESKNPIPTGMEFDEETSNEICSRLFEKATQKIGWGEARHDTAVWFFIQCKDSAIPFEFAKGWIDPFLDLARESGAQRRVTGDELQRVLGWAYSKERRDPSPTVARKLAEMEPEEPQPDGIPPCVSLPEQPVTTPPETPQPLVAQTQPDSDLWLTPSQALLKAKDVSHRFLTRIPTLDRITGGGIPRGRVLLMAGAPGAGKTTLAIQIACDMAVKGAVAGLLLADEGLTAGVVRMAQRIGFEREKLEAADPETIQKASTKLRKIDDRILCIDPDHPQCTMDNFIAGMDKLAGDLPQVWLIDSAQTVFRKSGGELRTQIKDIADRIKAEGRRRGAVVIFLSQTNRAAYRHKKDEDNANPLSASAESGAIEHMADVMIFFSPDGENRAKVVAPKNRLGSGPLLVPFHLALDRVTATYSEVEENVDETGKMLDDQTKKLKVLRAKGEKILKELKLNPEGLTGRQISEAVGGKHEYNRETLELLRGDGKVFSEPIPKGGMLWKASR